MRANPSPRLRFSQRLALAVFAIGMAYVLVIYLLIDSAFAWSEAASILRDGVVVSSWAFITYWLAEREMRLRAYQAERDLKTLHQEKAELQMAYQRLEADLAQARAAQSNQAMQLEAALTQLKNLQTHHEQNLQAQQQTDATQTLQQVLIDALLQIPSMASRARHLVDFNADVLTIMHHIAPHHELIWLTYDHGDLLMGLRRTQGATTAAPSYVDHKPHRPLLARLASSSQPLTQADLTDLDWVSEFEPEKPRSLLACAILFGSKPLGFVLLASLEDDAYTDDHRRRLLWLSHAVAPSLQLIRTIHKNRESGFYHERTRIARHLHDNLAQQLFHLAMTSDFLAESAQSLNQPKLAEGLQQLAEAARQTNQEVRNLIEDIRPDYIQKYTLSTLIEQSAERFRKRSGLNVVLDLRGDTQGVPYHIKESICHIVEEGLHNIYKHAKAKNVALCLQEWEAEQVWVLSIQDDGRGFNVDQPIADKHLGVKIMRDRAKDIQAEFVISSSPNQGTRIELKWSK
ncbi:MAG: histidine kinase [Anaerolineae bacterium]|nr:histidine kinase [Anaerolineae bacterium]MDW8171142.1 histidine kinase [Anaerolineae bacterium]